MRVLAGRYSLHERIGAGGMGEVWRATDDLLGRTVAVKLILPALLDEPDFARRFLAEARAMASVRHPGVLAIHDFHADGTGAYLVMEYADGEPVSRLLGRAGRLGPAATMDLVRQAALALQAVHDRGIVHRDVKPANLLLRADGTLALADFGIALGQGNTSLTRSGAVIGTPLYLAPEQVLGQPASPLSDVYALGVVAYECLAGRPPFSGDNPFAVAMQRVAQPPPPLGPWVPPAVAGVIERALAADPALRWPSAADFALAAERAGAALPPGRHAAEWVAATAAHHHEVPVARHDIPAARHQDVLDARHRGIPVARHHDVPVARPSAGRGEPGRPRRGATVAVVALTLALIGGATAGVVHWRSNPGSPAAASTSTSGAPGKPAPDGFVTCGDALCPGEPMCWRGLVQQGDIPLPPARADCAGPHYWETFAAIPLPAGADTNYHLSHLMDRPDVADLCSAATLAGRSRDPAHTPDWRREAWPIPADPYTVLVHCLGGSPDGETPGAAFRSG